MSELCRLGAGEIAARVASGEVSAAEVLESCYGRIVETEPKISAYLDLLGGDARRRA
ncbi:MAG: Asp-tRNA(Asn)/Glu-tRNA(Gln) amidotransferase subunit GatA, partial [Thermoanaerobaculia bacterium]|nr:Asp-tRNA(Asn)/Glu-tRNA(Gln) amidotransferase subunit GatA [Thermoanaerobaculia bacterium]